MNKSFVLLSLALSSALSLSACGGSLQSNQVNQSITPAVYAPQSQVAPNPGAISPPGSPLASPPTQAAPIQPNGLPRVYQAQTAASGPLRVSLPPALATQPNPAAPRMAPVAPPQAPPTQVAPQQAAPLQAAPQVSMAQTLVNQAVQSFEALQSFKFKVDGYEDNDSKGPSTLSFYMSALHKQVKIEVTQHSNSLYVGVKMAYLAGQNKISVRPGGMLGFVKVDTQMDDDRLLTPRGYRLDQIDPYALVQRLLKGPQEPKVLGKTQLNGRNLVILEYTHANDFDSRITRELLGLDLEDHFIRLHEMYAGNKRVFSLKISEVQLNLPLSAKVLEI